MERNFYDNDDFEEFLKQKADQYKMYPSDRVWNNVYRSLHGGNKRIVIGIVTLALISSGLFIGREAVISNYNRIAANVSNEPQVLPAAPSAAPLAVNRRRLAVVRRLHPQPVVITESSAAASTASSNTSPLQQPSAIPGTASPETSNSVPQQSDHSILLFENAGAPVTDAPVSAGTADVTNGKPQTTKPHTVLSVADTVQHTKTTLPVNESAVASIIKPAKQPKWFVQVYASPIISYRRLTNDSKPGLNAPVSADYAGNINHYVEHKPAPGFEVGGKLQFKISDNLRVYAGAQLNYSRYYIDAYKYSIEKASIALGGGRSSDTISGYTNIRNFSGFAPEQLQNQYWQFSFPLGIEVKLLGNKRLQFNVAGGVQPTFLISSNSYLISSDYKNYFQSPDLGRNFNVHTNFEAFFSYQAAGFKWQLGPQFRSQLMSSYSNQYHVREYLTEFGIKFAITKSIW